MRPLRTRLQEARRRLGIPWEALERDYLLSWILAGISRTPVLRDALVFKGGTALRKCYFGDYRFSEDLDFSTLKGIPTGNEIEGLISPNPPKDTDGRREDSGRGVRELQGRWPGLHWGRWEVGGRSSVAAQGPYGRLRELRCAGWRENTQQGTLADRGGASLRGRWVSCSLAVRPGVEWLAAGPRRE